jgi:CRP-like cAMP-binding protein
VRLGGRFIRLPIAKLETAKRKSATLLAAFARYTDCLLAQTVQSISCNAAHSIEQRAAKCIVAIMERTGHDLVPLTHAQLANMPGVGRSYASRVIETFKAERILETGRGSFVVCDPAALREKACLCDVIVGQHFEELMGRVYLAPCPSSRS